MAGADVSGSQLRGADAGEHGDHDGQQDGEGAPGGAGGEAQEGGDNKDHGRQEVGQAGAEALHDTGHELGGAQGLGDVADSPGEAEDQDGGHHLLEALGQAVHQLGEAHGAADHEVDHVDDQGNQAAQSQGGRGAGVGEGGEDVMAAALEADDQQAGHAADDQDDNGDDQVDGLAVGVELHLGGIGIGAVLGGVEIALGGVVLVGLHGAVVDVHAGHHDDEHHGQDGVIVVGDGLQEDLEANLLVADNAGDGRGPGGHGHHDTNRSGGGVAHVGQLGAGDVVAVRHGAHHVAGGQVVEVVVHAQHDGQDEGGPQGAGLGLDVGNSPVAVGLGAAGTDHQGHHGAQDDQEHQDAGVAAHVAGQAVNKVLQGKQGVAVHIQEAADHNAQEQGGVNLLRNESQNDCHHRGQQGHDSPPGSAGGRVTLCKGHSDQDGSQGEQD